MPLYTETHGSSNNPTLVFLHGFLGNSTDWQQTVEQLKETFYCITIDLPGHGRSVANSISLENGFQHCHQLISDALTMLNIHSFSLIGYSLGGRIALDYARSQNDNRLKSLILESCHIGLSNEAEQRKRYHSDFNWAATFATESITESLTQWYEQAVFADLNQAQKQTFIQKRSHNYGVYLANMLLATSLARQTNATDFLTKTELSITYFHGEKDNKFTKLAALLPKKKNIKLHCFDGIGHNIHQQIPLNYAEHIKNTLIK